MRRILRLPVDAPAGTAEGARKAFQTSMLVATVRCLLMYIVFPFVLPALGIAKGVGPAVGLAVNAVAMVCIVLSMRRFFRADHPKRWWYAGLGGAVLVALAVLAVSTSPTCSGRVTRTAGWLGRRRASWPVTSPPATPSTARRRRQPAAGDARRRRLVDAEPGRAGPGLLPMLRDAGGLGRLDRRGRRRRRAVHPRRRRAPSRALSPSEHDDYYEGFSNDSLWPLYHDAVRESTFKAQQWDAYVAVNERFAERLAEVAPPAP